MLRIMQVAENEWQLLRGDAVLSTHGSYVEALGVLTTLVDTAVRELAAAAPAPAEGETEGATTVDGLLPEVWEDAGGIAFSDVIEQGFRDFSSCDWSWRDPGVSLIPLMLQTCTDVGHYGAELAGFVETFSLSTGTVRSSGRFYDSETGRQFRDMLLGGRRFGVSVDPGPNTVVEEECVSIDEEDGWCDEWTLIFQAYEIIGVTGTPFPGFEQAAIQLRGTGVAASARRPDLSTRAAGEAISRGLVAGIAAGAGTAHRTETDSPVVSVPSRPPRQWMGEQFLPFPTPLTITREGHVFAHVCAWGTRHTGDPNLNSSILRGADLRPFLSAGRLPCDDGSIVNTGALTWGIPHADLSASLLRTQAHYADSRYGWADVVMGEDQFGVWISGALRPGLTEDDLRVLRALALSGDWRWDHTQGRYATIAALAVNYPGFPLPGVTASGVSISSAMPAIRREGGRPMAITAAGIVRPHRDEIDPRLARMERELADLRGRIAEPMRVELRRHRREVAAARLRG